MTAFVFNLQTGLLQKDSSVVYLAFLISLSKCTLYIFTTLAVYDKLALNILLQEYRRFVLRYTKPAQLQKNSKGVDSSAFTSCGTLTALLLQNRSAWVKQVA